LSAVEEKTKRRAGCTNEPMLKLLHDENYKNMLIHSSAQELGAVEDDVCDEQKLKECRVQELLLPDPVK
jgi:hypothetical protein